jgi:lambda family phage tail tape measure protein
VPTDRQISQLVLQVDANVAVAQRSLQDLARVVNQSSGQMNDAIGSTVRRHAQLDQAFNQSRLAQMELTHVVTASVDAYAAGASPLRILTLEMGRVAQAASFMGGGAGALGKVAGFMSGGWGIAVLLGVNVLAQLFAKMGQGTTTVADLVQKMREHAKEAANSKAADDAWANSIDGLIERNEKLTDDLKKRLRAEEDLDAQSLRNAQRDKVAAEQALQQDKTRLANLQAQLRAVAAAPASGATAGSGVGSQAAQLRDLERQIDEVKQDIVKDQQGIASAQSSIVQSTIATGEALGKATVESSAAVDLWAKSIMEAVHNAETAMPNATATISGAVDQVKKAMEDAAGAGVPFRSTGLEADKLIQKLQQGKTGPLEFASAMKELAKQLEAVAQAAKDAKKNTGELSSFNLPVNGTITGHFGDQRPGHRHAGVDIAVPVGTAVKAPAAGTVIEAGTLPGYGNVVFIDHGGGTISRLAHLSQISVQRGQQVAQGSVIGLSGGAKGAEGAGDSTGPHVHYEVRVGGKAVDPLKGRFTTDQAVAELKAQKDATNAAQTAAEQQDRFNAESAQLDAETLAARKQLASGYDTQADLAAQEIEAQRQAAQAAIQKQLDAKQITAEQAAALRLQVDDTAAAKQAVVAHEKYVRGLQQAGELQDQQFGFQVADLKFADDMARTQEDHRKLQLEILDIQYQQKEADLERLKKTIESNRDFAKSVDLQNQAAQIQNEIDRLPQEKAHDQARVYQGTLNPLEQWAKTVPQTAAEITEALQSIEAQGLDGIASAIADVVTGTRSMGEAFKDISHEIIGEIVQMTIKMLIFRALTAAFGGVFGGGGAPGGPISVNGGTSSYFSANPFGGFRAGGGTVSSGESYIVGENGPELFVPAASGMIVPNASRIGRPSAANNNTPQQVVVHVSTDENFHAEVATVAGQVVIQAAPTLIATAQKQTMRAIQRPTIAGRR